MEEPASAEIGLLLCGDVMLGRGIDQLLPHPGDPTIYEHWRYVHSARAFIELAQRKNGVVPNNRGVDYVWGDALTDFAEFRPDLRLINLETAITARGQPWPRKRIHYRMHPRNIDVLTHAGIDFCALANNHVLDWGYPGLEETIDTLTQAGIRHAGAGRDRIEAGAPAILEVPGKGRVVVVSLATPSSGVPTAWAAGRRKPGINLIGLTDRWFGYVCRRIADIKRAGDILVASIHWGGNFGYALDQSQRDFARRLIDEARVDLVHGHSSHHVKGIEVHNGKPILYGCGDLINDYEGIPKSPKRQSFAPELGMIYFARFSIANSRLVSLQMRPTRMNQMRIRRGDVDDARRLCAILNEEGAKLGTHVVNEDGILSLHLATA